MEDEKLESSLGLSIQLPEEERRKSEALSTGFSYDDNTWEVILRIAGSVEALQQQFPSASFRLLSGEYVIGLIPQEILMDVANADAVIYIEQPKRLCTGVAQGKIASCITPLQQEITPAGALTGRGVFVGVIDSGIDYFHEDFRNADGTTRIAWLFDDGKEYSAEQINEALRAPTKRESYEIVPSQDASGHGTHVAGIAAGNGRASGGLNRGVAFESELIVAKLGNARKGGFPKTTQLMEAVERIKEKAEQNNRPVAINISFGNNYGSHTGTSLLETYLTQVANQWKMSIAVGTGNEGDTALHKEGRLNSNQSVSVEIGISEFESSINLQLWKNYQDVMSVVLLAPNGEEVLRATNRVDEEGQQRIVSGSWQNTDVYLYAGAPSPYSIFQEYYFSFLPKREYLDSGVWRVRIEAKQVKDGRYSLWLPTGGVLNPKTGFLQPSEETTLTIPATADKVISVGAYDSRRNQYALFSGRGYTWDTEQIKPDLVAPGVDILSTAIGGGYQTRSGTSMATPFVTGSAALIMQWGIINGNDPFAYGEKLKAYLLRGANSLYQESMPSPRTGWGKLCVQASIPGMTR